MSEPKSSLVLESFRVRGFRQVRDSGTVPVFPLTALVGREDSGKTSLLLALRGLSPEVEAPYSLRRDWPRGRRAPAGPDHVACRAHLRFADESRRQLLQVAELPASTAGLVVGRTYGGELLASPWDGLLEENGAAPPSELAPEGPAIELARAHLPRLVFLDARASIPDHLPRESDAAARDSVTAALASLLAEVGLPLESLWSDSSPERVHAAGERLGQLLQQRGGITRLTLRAERGRVELHAARAGRVVRADRLEAALRYRLAVELCIAAAIGTGSGPPVLLLDGPGRALRRRNGVRMRSLLEAWTRRGLTVLYTARLPFDLELQHPEQVLVLAPSREGPQARHFQRGAGHAEVRAALGMTGRASFRIAEQNLVVEGPTDVSILTALDGLFRRSGEPGLLRGMEVTAAGGSHEVTAIARFLGHEALAVVALFDSDAAGHRSADGLEQAVRSDPRLARVAVLRLARAAGLPFDDATIEDLFPPADYLQEVRRLLAADAGLARHLDALAHAKRRGSLATRVAKLAGSEGLRFPKGKVAEALAARVASMHGVSELPWGMRGPARRLLRAIRRAARAYPSPTTDAPPHEEPRHEP